MISLSGEASGCQVAKQTCFGMTKENLPLSDRFARYIPLLLMNSHDSFVQNNRALPFAACSNRHHNPVRTSRLDRRQRQRSCQSIFRDK